MAKESACQCRRQTQDMRIGSLDQEDPWRKKWQPTPVFLPKKFYGQRSLTGYSSRDPKDLDMTEHTCTYLTYNGVLISAVRQSDSGIHTHGFLSIFFSIIISKYNKYGKYGSPLLCIHPICDSLHLLTPNSQSISSLPLILRQL